MTQVIEIRARRGIAGLRFRPRSVVLACFSPFGVFHPNRFRQSLEDRQCVEIPTESSILLGKSLAPHPPQRARLQLNLDEIARATSLVPSVV